MEMSELLDKARTRANLPSDYALAKATGISQQIISGIRKGRRHPSNEEAVKLATLAGLDEMQVIAEIEMKTAKTDAKKEFWHQFLERRGIAACISMTALACSIALAQKPAEATVLQLQNYGESQTFAGRNIHYTNRKRRRENWLMIRALFHKYLDCFRLDTAAHAPAIR